MVRARDWPLLAAATAVLAPVIAAAWLLAHPAQNAVVAVPVEHFWIVSAVSMLALALSTLLAWAATKIRNYRAVLLALGFASMGGLFTVHGLATPGVLLTSEPYVLGPVVGVSAFLSLLVPSLLFALAYTPAARLERRVRVGPLRLGVGLLVVALAAYAALALAMPELVARIPLLLFPFRPLAAAATIAALLYAGGRQLSIYRDTTRPTQLALALCFGLLADAQLVMNTTVVWTLAWWVYHLAMLAAVALALRSLAIERAGGVALRETVEALLALEVEVGDQLTSVERIAAFAHAIELKDRELKGHNVRVAELSVEIGRALGLDSNRLRVLARAGLLHDLGKLDIPDAILLKPGPLTPAEWAVMRRHPELGVRLMKKAGRLRREQEIVLAHHERMDGSGYPRGLAGERIPLEARIIAVVDTFDVLLSDRPYRSGRPPAAAFDVLVRERASKLDPVVVDTLFELRPLVAERAAVSA